MTRILKLWSAGSAKLLAVHFPSVLVSPRMVDHYCLHPAHWFGLQLIAHTIVWLYWNLTVGRRQYQWTNKGLWQWCLICNINLLDRIHCLKCFSHNVPGVESTPIFRWGFVIRMTVFLFIFYFSSSSVNGIRYLRTFSFISDVTVTLKRWIEAETEKRVQNYWN